MVPLSAVLTVVTMVLWLESWWVGCWGHSWVGLLDKLSGGSMVSTSASLMVVEMVVEWADE